MISSSRSPPPQTTRRRTASRSRYSNDISTTRSLNGHGRDHQRARPRQAGSNFFTHTLAELSGGRFLLGLGCGWHRRELDAFGIPSDRLVSRFEEYVEALLPLLRGDCVDYEGRYVRLSRAEVL